MIEQLGNRVSGSIIRCLEVILMGGGDLFVIVKIDTLDTAYMEPNAGS